MTERSRLPQDIDEEVDRAVQAVRTTAGSRDLPPHVRAAIVAKMQAAARRGDALRFLDWVVARRLRSTVAAAASVLIAVTAVAVIVALLGRGGVAFAQVKAAIQQAQTIQMTVDSTVGQGPNTVRMRLKMRVKAPGWVRMETETGESVVTDARQKMMLTIEPDKRRAMLIDIPQLPDRTDTSPRNILERMRQVLDGSEKRLGGRQIDGRPTQGFAVTKDNCDMEIWAEESTGELVLIRLDFHIPGLPPTHMILRDIVLNADMPDSLFRLAPPEGFTLENHAKNLGTPGEQDLAEGLRDLAGWNGGTFPEQLQPSVDMGRTIEQSLATLEPGLRTAKVHRLTRMVFFAGLRYEQDFHYAGGGVTLGDASRSIAWWKPKGAKTYRVLMGDLTFRELPAGKLPSAGAASRRSELPQPPSGARTDVRLKARDRIGTSIREAARIASVADPTAGKTLTVTVAVRATQTGLARSGLEVTLANTGGHTHEVTGCTPARG
ncbi:MAG: hypothetical protein MUP47_06835 [Phycisphaerae bacterium]|nr:hypothetical protein [Phycisphaerae bacterium]